MSPIVNSTTDTLKKPSISDRTDRAWFSRLVYDIRPRNGAGLFFQPRSPHGANQGEEYKMFPAFVRAAVREAATICPRPVQIVTLGGGT